MQEPVVEEEVKAPVKPDPKIKRANTEANLIGKKGGKLTPSKKDSNPALMRKQTMASKPKASAKEIVKVVLDNATIQLKE